MAVNRFRVELALMRSAVVALTVLTLTLIGAPELAAQQETPEVSTQGTDDETAEKKKKKEKKQKAEGEEKKGPSFIPIPVFITEPAIGYGGGVALGYFHKKKDGESSDERLAPGLTATSAGDPGRGQKRPPTVSGIAAAYTDKGSWGAGLGHYASWAEDTIRYKGALGYVNVESEFWFLNRPFDFNLQGGLLYQDIQFRMGKSKFWLGGKLVYVNADLKFKVDPPSDDRDPIESRGRNIQDFGLALQAVYDGLDNQMTPNSGLFVELITYKYFESKIGDFDYFKAGFRVISFHQFAKDKLVLGLRLDIDAAVGDPPLWGYPWIVLRGVPALRYQNERTGVVEAELRWNIFDRWAVLVFAGAGRTNGDTRRYPDESGIYAGGIGGRYLFRPQDDLWVGVDLARGPEQGVFYIQVGHAW